MNTRVIYLDNDDDIISICDRLNWEQSQRALLVLPAEGKVLRAGLDLARLRRHADRMRLEIGLISPDAAIRQQATALGIPAFLTVEAASQSRRGWWRGRRRRERIGLPTVGEAGVAQLRPQPLDPHVRRGVQQRLTRSVSWQRWLLRYVAVVLFFLILGGLVVAFLVTVPTATLTLRPAVQTVEATRIVLADPELAEVDYGRGAVPGRLLTVENVWQATAPATGVTAVPNAAARGKVLFVNLGDNEVRIPAGTRVSTTAENSVAFQTIQEVVVAGVEGSTAEVDVIAIEPGPQGNVAANLVNRIEGALATQLEVRNLEPLDGGAVRQATAVSEADQTRLRAQVLQFLQALAISEMEAQVSAQEFLARPSLRVVSIVNETYSHFPGEQTNELTLEMRAVLQGTAVNTGDAVGLLYETLATDLPEGNILVAESISLTVGDVVGVDEAGRVTFEMVATGVVAADLQLDGPLTAVAGQAPEAALAYLYEQLPLRDVPTIDIWPTWFQRMPYLPTRIHVDIRRAD